MFLNLRHNSEHVDLVISSAGRPPENTGFVRVLENLESPGILLWHFPGLESPGKRPLVLESSGNLLNSTKDMKCLEGSKENLH